MKWTKEKGTGLEEWFGRKSFIRIQGIQYLLCARFDRTSSNSGPHFAKHKFCLYNFIYDSAELWSIVVSRYGSVMQS